MQDSFYLVTLENSRYDVVVIQGQPRFARSHWDSNDIPWSRLEKWEGKWEEAAPFRTPEVPRVIVQISGGNFQGARSSVPVDLGVLDYDNKKAAEAGMDNPDSNAAKSCKDEAEYHAGLEREWESLPCWVG